MESRWLCCAMPITTWPTRVLSSAVLSRAAWIAWPPSWVAVKPEKRPGVLLSTRMSARGVRRPPSRITMLVSPTMAAPIPSLVQECRRHARAILDEILHADIQVNRSLAAAEAMGLQLQALGEGH